MTHVPTESNTERLSLERAATHLLEECRMILPGIQALFGFQFVAVFNAGFSERLSMHEREAHLAALMCVLLSAALVLAPAAIHRHAQPRSVSSAFLTLSSRLLMWSMPPLAIGTSIDVYLVARIITGHSGVALTIAGIGMLIFALAWGVLPSMARRAFGAAAAHDADPPRR